jgi:hypothetical protein
VNISEWNQWSKGIAMGRRGIDDTTIGIMTVLKLFMVIIGLIVLFSSEIHDKWLRVILAACILYYVFQIFQAFRRS